MCRTFVGSEPTRISSARDRAVLPFATRHSSLLLQAVQTSQPVPKKEKRKSRTQIAHGMSQLSQYRGPVCVPAPPGVFLPAPPGVCPVCVPAPPPGVFLPAPPGVCPVCVPAPPGVFLPVCKSVVVATCSLVAQRNDTEHHCVSTYSCEVDETRERQFYFLRTGTTSIRS